MHHRFALVPIACLGLSSAAWADGYSADIEIIHPTFAYGAVPGVDDVKAQKYKTVRVGLLAQYEKNPLILRARDHTRLGSVVGNRLAFDLGASFDVSRRLAFRVSVPLAASFGSTVDEYKADGFGLGDVGFGATFRLTRQASVVHIGVRADVDAPLGSRSAWLGEARARFGGGVVVSGAAGPLGWSTNLGVTNRQDVITQNGLVLGSEGWFGASVKLDVVPNLISALGGTVGRVGFNEPIGGGETGVEVYGGGRVILSKRDNVDLLVGKGFANGYGTTDLRLAVAYTWTGKIGKEPIVEDEPEPEPEVDQAVVDRIPTLKIIVDEPDIVPEVPKPPPEPLAKLVDSRIEVRDPIKFYVGTNRVLPESIPTLQAVAALIKPGDLLIIEGRASVEGQFKYNYDLSVSRAQIIYEELLRTGVSPANLAWRALGEVAPVIDGTDEKQLAENRRVSFYVIPLPGGPPPSGPAVTLPWDGTTVPSRPTEVKP